jgi:hypothetical protein
MKARKSTTRTTKARKLAPALTLTPSVGRVKQKEVVSVAVAFDGVEEVAFRLEPKGAFSLDLNPMARPGTLRLKGLLDGTATLVASGRTAGKEVVRRELHLYCEGPIVRIVASGYIPFEG